MLARSYKNVMQCKWKVLVLVSMLWILARLYRLNLLKVPLKQSFVHFYINHLYDAYNIQREIKFDDRVQNSPAGRPYFRSRPVGLEGVTQSMLTSFLKHWSMSTELKKATDWGRSCMPNVWANIHLQETRRAQSQKLSHRGYFVYMY